MRRRVPRRGYGRQRVLRLDGDGSHHERAAEFHVRADVAVPDHVEVRAWTIDPDPDLSCGRVDDRVGCGAHALEGDLVDVREVEVAVGRHFYYVRRVFLNEKVRRTLFDTGQVPRQLE